ncbi:glycosyl transferase family 2 [Tamilnaduibacter salinus]|uniref:Glycosyl transferase family 2 n=1 Tax=Tamilnaduibacter salinus TaxID=1484056 RepID=A0A2U1CUA6_9GAMM|nr:glycosyltransferase family A protein [Tamilnaduibacter salinus]PVY70343.1 glycosyl transferase family 2 [Tamilnaduibacter salinus]
MIFFVFSFNRGPHLRNCIRSIETCAPGQRLVVFDDDSTDPETQDVLADIAERHEVYYPKVPKEEGQHGGLYANMQRAFDMTSDDELIVFLQDDTQLVRPLSASELDDLSHYFDRFPNVGFLAPVFRFGITRKRVLNRFIYQPDRQVYFCEHHSHKAQAGVYYSDISVSRSDRLRAVGWRFKPDEYENEQQAKAHFDKMGYLYAPFAMWLPNAPVYRFKDKSFLFQLGERINQSGLYPYKIMDEAAVARLKSRPGPELAIAENHLSIDGKTLKKPWIFDPLRRPRWLRRIAKIDRKVRQLLSKLGLAQKA